MPLTIRKAIPADHAIISEFNALMARETEHKTLDTDLVSRGVEGVLHDDTNGVYYVAEADGEVVGQLMITYEWSDWRNGRFWWIQSVYVKEEWRGKKVFTALYEHIRSLAKTDKTICGLRLYVEGENDRAQRTYETLGMKPTGYVLYELDFREGNGS
jgi:GNAT superfamily N-acetyltransferase